MPYTKDGHLLPGDPQHGTRWATDDEKAAAAHALHELETQRNRIALVPAPQQNFHSHKIRVQVEQNPKWYRDFGASFWRGKRSFQLKRVRVERALRRVCETGIVRRNGYEVGLLEALVRR
jgi:hypothetical protein